MRSLPHFGEHYNARGLAPETIAGSFVPSHQFWQVSAHGNSVLVGPRGSGKTTLLRMLDPRALNTWLENEESQHPDEWHPPEFVGVFVPIDTAWVSSLEKLVNSGERDPSVLYLAVYSLSVAKCLVDVMRWRLIGSGESAYCKGLLVGDSVEPELAKHLGDLYLSDSSMRSLLELRIELTKLIAKLPGEWLASQDDVSSVGSLANVVQITSVACDLFNQIVGEPTRRWALLCDELEIAPKSVREHLFSALRAVPASLFLKIALTPKERLDPRASTESPLPANDYEVISLSYATREEGPAEKEREEFCVAMWRSLVLERGGAQHEDLGNPHRAFEAPRKGGSRRLERRGVGDLESKFGAIFRSLATKDKSFALYLAAKGIDVEDLDRNDQSKRDSVIRKVRAIVEAREHGLRLAIDGRLVRVPRKSYTMYCGAHRVFAVSEGHPRWLKYTLGAMLARSHDKPPYIRLTDQGREIRDAVQRVRARLKALPVGESSAFDLVDLLGNYFSGQIFGEQFKADPALSFVVDDDVSDDVLEAVAKALYLGALVPLQTDVFQLFTLGLTGRRFRLSNWLAPAYSLPLMTGKQVQLSTVIARASNSLASVAVEEVDYERGQYSLGFDQ